MQSTTTTSDIIKNKKDYAREIIKNRIVNNVYKPMDSLTEQSLCTELNISKTPIREALKELEKDGFVKVLPGKGCLVSSISLDYIREIFEIREILECAAARIVAQRSDKSIFEDILRHHESFEYAKNNNVKDSLIAGYSIHSAILESMGNSRLFSFYMTIQSHIIRIRLFFLHQFGITQLNETNAEHREILEAIIAGDPDNAEQVMREHLRNGQRRIKNLL